MSLKKDGTPDSEGDNSSKPFFKKKEAYVLSILIGLLALSFEIFILLADSSGGGRGRLLVFIPVSAVLSIRLIFKNSQ